MSDRKKRLTKALSMALGLLSMGGQFSSASNTTDDYYAPSNPDFEVEDNGGLDVSDLEQLKSDVRAGVGADLEKLSGIENRAKELSRSMQVLRVPGASSPSLLAYQQLSEDLGSCLDTCASVRKQELDILSRLADDGDIDEIGNAVDGASRKLVMVENLLSNCETKFRDLRGLLRSDAENNNESDVTERKLNLRNIKDRLDSLFVILDDLTDKLNANNVVGTYDNRVDGLRSSLFKLRTSFVYPRSDDDGMVARDFELASKQIDSVAAEIGKLREEIEGECSALGIRTDYDVFTDALTTLEVQWAAFNRACNPDRLSSEMVETTRNQAMRSYERGKKTYEELRAMLIEKSDAACDVEGGGIVGATPQTEDICRQALKKLSSALALSRKMFEKAAQSNIIRPKSRSLTSERQYRAKTFFKNCRSINARESMSDAQKRSALLGELSKLLPGREELHSRLFNVVVAPVEMNKQGCVEASALQRKNVLLIGNVGTGKTEEVNRVLEAANIKSIFAKPGDFSTSESADAFWENFLMETENSNNDVVIVLDEIESILPSRWGEQEVSPAVANFNIFMEKLASKPSLMAHYRGMIGTTNLSQERLDPALVSRIANVITVPSLSGDRLVEAVAGLTRTVTFDATCSRSEVNETIADIMERQNISIRDFINILESEVDKQRKLNVDPAAGASDTLVLRQDGLYAALRGLNLTGAAGSPAKT